MAILGSRALIYPLHKLPALIGLLTFRSHNVVVVFI